MILNFESLGHDFTVTRCSSTKSCFIYYDALKRQYVVLKKKFELRIITSLKHLVRQPGNAPKSRPSHLTMADVVNKRGKYIFHSSF